MLKHTIGLLAAVPQSATPLVQAPGGAPAALDWLALTVSVLVSVAFGVLFYLTLLARRIRAGGHPAALRWWAAVTGAAVWVAFVSGWFWSDLASLRWWAYTDALGPAAVWIMGLVWLASFVAVTMYDKGRRFR